MTKPPNQVMRFYGNVQYALECIALKQITFLHIDKLNDPFDPYFYFETDFNDDYQEIINFIQHNNKNDLLNFKQTLPEEKWERALKGMREYLYNTLNNICVFSTIEIFEEKHPKDNLYMWSHYGYGHRGVAIEFNTYLLAKAVLSSMKNQKGATNNVNEVWSKIDYQKEPAKITCEHVVDYVMDRDNTQLINNMTKNFSSKSMIWESEKEWRLIWKNDETKLNILRLDLIDGSITAVYLGCRIADNFKDDIIFEMNLNFPKAEIFMARKAKGKFALEFERIALPSN